tara:strand:+ start:203 stop:448 length:246 start_codon:yes stop_codon:yes gene_type:complete
MAFSLNKQGKLSDQLEAQAYDWVITDIEEQYGTDDVESLDGEQIDEIEEYLNDEEVWIEDYSRLVLQTIVDNHPSRLEEYQ